MGNIVQPLWADSPALTRLLCVGYPALTVLTTLADMYDVQVMQTLFSCSFNDVVKHYHVWALFLGPFSRHFKGGISFLMVLFEIYMMISLFPSQERDLGSTLFAIWLLLINFTIDVIYIAIMGCLSLVPSHMGYFAPMIPIQGLWPSIIVCWTLRCLTNPTGTSNFWGLFDIPNKWYPIFMVGIFSLMNLTFQWDSVAALLVGYGYPYLPLERLLPSKSRAGALERWCAPSGRCSRTCLGARWIMAADTTSAEVESGSRRYANLSDFNPRPQQMQAMRAPSSSRGGGGASDFSLFSGSGNRLGDGDLEPPPLLAPAGKYPSSGAGAAPESPARPPSPGDLEMVIND